MLSIWERKSGEWVTAQEESAQQGGQQVDHSQGTKAYYEDDAILRSYHRFHFDDSPILGSVPNLSVQMAKICIEMCRRYSSDGDLSDGLALDAGAGKKRTNCYLISLGGATGPMGVCDILQGSWLIGRYRVQT